MTAEGHIIFSVACAIFSKNAKLTYTLTNGDWWHIIPSAVLASLLPDLDHPKSLLGQRMRWISTFITKSFGHRGFTHSFLAMFSFALILRFLLLRRGIVPLDVFQGINLGYVSHIFADILTPAGVPLLWPYRLRFRFPIIFQKKSNKLERIFCIVVFFIAILWPNFLCKRDIICLLSKTTEFLLMQFTNLFNL